MSIHDSLPDAEALLALEPEELASAVLEHLSTNPNDLHVRNFSLRNTAKDYPEEFQERVLEALMESWSWLDREGLIAPKPGNDPGWMFITRRGKRIKSASDLAAYCKSTMLPKRLLHPAIAQKIWYMFIRSEYDTAVFQAFKEVEVAVRKAGKFESKDLGVNLMRDAFRPLEGPLTDTNAPEAEQQALRVLFEGAIGSYKNPHSHRNVDITPEEAVEMIFLASHLLRIVDSRSSNHD